MIQPALVLIVPQGITDRARDEIRRGIDAWNASGRRQPLLLEEGIRPAILGGLSISIQFHDGPLAGIQIGLTLSRLDDLPAELAWDDGRYVRWTAEDGVQMQTSEHKPLYRWETDR